MPKLNWCPRSQYFYRRTDEAGVIRDTPFPCKSWECPYCGKGRSEKLRETLELAFSCFSMEGYTWPYHATLTMNPARITRKQAWATIGKRFDRLRRGLQRDASGIAPIYARILGQNPDNGYPHLHLLLLLQPAHSQLSDRKLRDRLEDLWGPDTGGGFVRVRRVDGMDAIPKAVRYVMRHLRETMPFLPKRSRRVSVSRDIKFWDQEGNRSEPPKTDRAGGERKRGDIILSAEALRAKGYRVTFGPRGLTARPPRA